MDSLKILESDKVNRSLLLASGLSKDSYPGPNLCLFRVESTWNSVSSSPRLLFDPKKSNK